MKEGVETPAATERGRRRRNVKLKKHLLAKMFSWPVPQQQAGTSPQRYGRKSRLPRQRGRNDAATSYPSGNTRRVISCTVHNTRHHDVRNQSAGLEAMVGGRGKQSRPLYCRPGGPATISSVTTHDQVSRRRVALDARNQNPRTSKGIPAAKKGRSLGRRPQKETKEKQHRPRTAGNTTNKGPDQPTRDTDSSQEAAGRRRQEQRF